MELKTFLFIPSLLVLWYDTFASIENKYCETLAYINNLKAAGIEAEVDVYEGMYHAFDMSEPESTAGKKAIKRFNEHFAYAKEHYFADQIITR